MGQKKSMSQWAHSIGISPRALCARVNELGWSIEKALTTERGGTRSEPRSDRRRKLDESEVIQRYAIQHESGNLIARSCGVSPPVIYAILRRNGIAIEMGTRKYFFDQDYFEKIDTPRKAYWLGLFYADGCVSPNGVFSLGFTRCDRYILEKLAEDVGYNGPIVDIDEFKSIGKGKPKSYKSSRINLCSAKFCRHLIDKGVGYQKTLRLTYPTCVPTSLMRHFIRGLFDGDGFISKSTNNGRTQWMWGITGQPDLLNSCSRFVSDSLSIDYKKAYEFKGQNCSTVQYTAGMSVAGYRLDGTLGRVDDLIAIREWLYKNSDIHFTRKKEKFDQLSLPKECTGFSIEDAALMINIHERSLRRYIQMGHVNAYKEGHYRRIAKDEIVKLQKLMVSSEVLPWDGRLRNEAK